MCIFDAHPNQFLQLMLQPIMNILNNYNRQTPIQPKLGGCQGNCTEYIEASGLTAQCNTTTINVHYPANESLSNLAIPSTPFSVAFNYHVYMPDKLAQTCLSIAYSQNSQWSDCSEARTEVSCMLSPATLRYPVNMRNGAVTLGDALGSDSVVELQPKLGPIGRTQKAQEPGQDKHWVVSGSPR